MESVSDPSDSVRQLQRAEAAPYIQMPPSPKWVAPFFGAWFAAYVAAFMFWREGAIAFIVSMIVLSAGLGAFLGWMTRRYGALPMPGRGTPPPEIGREYRRYFVGVVVIAALVAGAWWWSGVVAAAVTAFVLVTAGMLLFLARYEQAAAAVRKRLA